MDSDFFTASLGQRQKSVLCNGEHTTSTAGSVITGIGSVFDFIGNRYEHKVGHELDNITRRPVFSGFLVIFFVKLPNQLLKNGTHAVVIKAGMFENCLFLIFVNRIRA